MEGILVITVKKEYPLYTGFDGGFGVDMWKLLDVWNTNNAEDKIEITGNEDFYNVTGFRKVEQYVKFVQQYDKEEYFTYCILVNSGLHRTPVEGFEFIGYDCGYLRGNGFSLLFSSIPNELTREVVNPVLQVFKSKLNTHGLFTTYEDALAFKHARDYAIDKGDIDYIETAFKDYSIVRIFMFKDSLA